MYRDDLRRHIYEKQKKSGRPDTESPNGSNPRNIVEQAQQALPKLVGKSFGCYFYKRKQGALEPKDAA